MKPHLSRRGRWWTCMCWVCRSPEYTRYFGPVGRGNTPSAAWHDWARQVGMRV